MQNIDFAQADVDKKVSRVSSDTSLTNLSSSGLGKLRALKNISSSPIRPFLSKHIPAANNKELLKNNYHRYCYRHNPDVKCNKKVDESKMIEIQENLEKLPFRDQEVISNFWTVFSAAPSEQRILILKGLLSQCCFPQLSFVASEVNDLIKIDFISALPMELSLKILCYLDCASLCNAAQVSRTWKRLADDDRVWHHLCEQHIDKKCPNCGWGLPLMHMKRARYENVQAEAKLAPKEEEKVVSAVAVVKPPLLSDSCVKRSTSDVESLVSTSAPPAKMRKTRPWKTVYLERFKVERNWRKGIFTLKEFKGHTDGILCMQFNHDILISGSYDSTIKVWNIQTGKVIRTLRGHTRGVRALVFDDTKLITGSLDSTIKVWNYKNGDCISTYRGHTDAIISLDMVGKTIISGSADKTIKIWNVETRTCHTLRGHTDWVNSVKVHQPSNTIISASDDCSIRLWSLKTNTCLKIFNGANGHIGQVQCALPITIKDEIVEDSESEDEAQRQAAEEFDPEIDCSNLPTNILSAGLDNQIKLWDVKSGRCIRTQFGHIEGVWSIATDTFRIVSGAHDKLVKIWDIQTGKCLHTFGGHNSVVNTVGISDSRFAGGDEEGVIRMYCFDT